MILAKYDYSFFLRIVSFTSLRRVWSSYQFSPFIGDSPTVPYLPSLCTPSGHVWLYNALKSWFVSQRCVSVAVHWQHIGIDSIRLGLARTRILAILRAPLSSQWVWLASRKILLPPFFRSRCFCAFRYLDGKKLRWVVLLLEVWWYALLGHTGVTPFTELIFRLTILHVSFRLELELLPS